MVACTVVVSGTTIRPAVPVPAATSTAATVPPVSTTAVSTAAAAEVLGEGQRRRQRQGGAAREGVAVAVAGAAPATAGSTSLRPARGGEGQAVAAGSLLTATPSCVTVPFCVPFCVSSFSVLMRDRDRAWDIWCESVRVPVGLPLTVDTALLAVDTALLAVDTAAGGEAPTLAALLRLASCHLISVPVSVPMRSM